jgi:PAS domain S-box-containing protein
MANLLRASPEVLASPTVEMRSGVLARGGVPIPRLAACLLERWPVAAREPGSSVGRRVLRSVFGAALPPLVAFLVHALLWPVLSRTAWAQRKPEEAVRTSEAKFSGLVAIALDAIVSVDKDQRIVVYNEGAERIFGWTAGEVLGKPLDMLLPERYRGAHRRHVPQFASERAKARPMGDHRSILGLRKNGEEFPLEGTISKLALDGDTRLFTAVLRDVTDDRRREDEQKFLAEVGSVLASTLDYEDTLTSVAEVAVRSLADLCVVDVLGDDGQASRLRVVTRDPAKGWLCDVLLRTPIDRRLPHMLWSVLEMRRPVLIRETSQEMGAGFSESEAHVEALEALRAFDVTSVLSVPLLAHAKVIGAMTFMSSTPSRLYGPADVRLAEELAVRAALAIENARLYREARLAIQARDEMLGVVAHDLRNPLNSILVQSQRLAARVPQSEPCTQSAVPAIHRAALRMNRLIEDLLDVTRIEAGRMAVEGAPVSPAEIVCESVEAQRQLASAASLDVRADLAPDIPEVSADRDRLLEVFENLIGNAIKFTDKGGSITVGARPRGGEVLFWVADTGAGIPAEHLAHVFERFWRMGEAGRRGTGLGLPIAKGLIEAHGGRIWVESAPGRGSTFFFTIPAAARA